MSEWMGCSDCDRSTSGRCWRHGGIYTNVTQTSIDQSELERLRAKLAAWEPCVRMLIAERDEHGGCGCRMCETVDALKEEERP